MIAVFTEVLTVEDLQAVERPHHDLRGEGDVQDQHHPDRVQHRPGQIPESPTVPGPEHLKSPMLALKVSTNSLRLQMPARRCNGLRLAGLTRPGKPTS